MIYSKALLFNLSSESKCFFSLYMCVVTTYNLKPFLCNYFSNHKFHLPLQLSLITTTCQRTWFSRTAPIFLSSISHDTSFYLIVMLPPSSPKNPLHYGDSTKKEQLLLSKTLFLSNFIEKMNNSDRSQDIQPSAYVQVIMKMLRDNKEKMHMLEESNKMIMETITSLSPLIPQPPKPNLLYMEIRTPPTELPHL